jgi:hypothetical protein
MISWPQEQVPWQNRRQEAELAAHDDPAPESDDDDNSTRRKTYFGPSRFYCTETACYPCGVVIGWTLFDKSESPTKILRFLESLFPTPESKPNFICIDKGCQVLRTVKAHPQYDEAWKHCRFIVDTYHYSNHQATDTLCQTYCNPTPADNSSPNLVIQEVDNSGVRQWRRAFNTQASEQLNAWISGFAQLLKRMTITNFCWFLHAMLYRHTKRVIRKQAEKTQANIRVIDSDNDAEIVD